MFAGVVSTLTHIGSSGPIGLAVCRGGDAKTGKQQLVVADNEVHRLRCVDLRTGTNIEISWLLAAFCA